MTNFNTISRSHSKALPFSDKAAILEVSHAILMKLMAMILLLSLVLNVQAATYSTNTTVTADVNDGMVINEGVTVTIAANVSVTGSTIDIKENGTLLINAGVTLETNQDVVNDNGTITINGVLNLINGEKKIENKAGGTINGSGTIMLAAGVDVFNNDGSDFFGYTGSNPLGPGGPCEGGECSSAIFPVTIASFEAKADRGRVILNWATETELNNDFFTVERSRNAKDWEPIKSVTGAGNSSQLLHYSIVDGIPFQGDNYYRLKQTDFDGTFTYSEIRAVDVKIKDDTPISVYPNPTPGQIRVQASSSMSDCRLYNLCGKDVSHLATWSNGAGNGFDLDLSGLPSGLYLLKTVDTTTKVYKQ